MKLEVHMHIIKNLRFPMKANIIRLLWIILNEHKEEIQSEAEAANKEPVEWILDQVMPPRRPRNYTPRIPMAQPDQLRVRKDTVRKRREER